MTEISVEWIPYAGGGGAFYDYLHGDILILLPTYNGSFIAYGSREIAELIGGRGLLGGTIDRINDGDYRDV